MSEEQRKNICRAFFSGHTVAEIARMEQISPEEAGKAIAWGELTHYNDRFRNVPHPEPHICQQLS